MALAASPVHAQYEVSEIPFINAPPGTAALGGGIRLGQDLYFAVDNEDTRQIDLVPLYLYNGKYLFFRGTAGGVHLYRNDSMQINLLGRYRFQKLDPSRNAFYDGIDERRQSLDGGVELRLRGKWGGLNANYLTDTLNRHKGDSAELTYRYRFDRGKLTLSPFVSYGWNDGTLTNYYFGVSEAEARPDRPEYAPGDSNWIAFGLNTTWWVSSQVQFFANMGFGGVDTVITDSPLVEESTQSAFFAGGTYIFGNVLEPTDYISPERKSEWAWRVNYGYQAEENIYGGIDQGDVSRSTFADTNIGGLTFSKLLSDGPRVDFFGNLALFRHFEVYEGNFYFWS
ncbi:MAG: MipA/OmpV family protein [Pseudomonadota bacterium]